MADTLYGLPINSLTSKKPESSDKFISYDDNEKQAHVTTAGELAETMNENLSDAFSSSKSYSAGDYCIYNDTLYKFTADHSGAWDNDDVEAVTVGDELNELNTNKQDAISIESGNGTRNSSYISSTNFDAGWRKYGRVVVLRLVLNMSATCSDNSVNLVTDIPTPQAMQYATLHSGASTGAAITVATDGAVHYGWAGNLTSGNTYRGQIIYISAD